MQRAMIHVSATTLRRNQVVLDAAYILYKRNGYQKHVGISRYALGDSSPQAGKDWFQRKEQWIYNRDLVKLADAVDAFAQRLQVSATPITDLQVQAYSQVIESALRTHTKAPMAKS